jgi:hypothetical protein
MNPTIPKKMVVGLLMPAAVKPPTSAMEASSEISSESISATFRLNKLIRKRA